MPDLTRARTVVRDGTLTADLSLLRRGWSCLKGFAPRLAGRSVLLAATSQVMAACLFVELDGLARRVVVAPPDSGAGDVDALIGGGEVDQVATDRPDLLARADLALVPAAPMAPASRLQPPRELETEWVLATSGTSGRLKLVAHTLATLSYSISQAPPGAAPRLWATFYDVRRYGGLQIFLRAIFDGTDLVVGAPGETLADHLARLGAESVTCVSGTPSHWRRVLMSGARSAIEPAYVRLSGEIVDQRLLDALAEAYPYARIGHAFASTEAGVGFAVEDGLEGFPAALLGGDVFGVAMKLEEGTLRVRSARAATRYLGIEAAPLKDADGFVDTGDLVEVRGERCHFVGRRGGIVNVGGLKVNPEEVEGVINGHPRVGMSLVTARRSPIVGSLVSAEVVAREPGEASDDLRASILDLCRSHLAAHKVPALLRFVPALPCTAAGKLLRCETKRETSLA